MELDLVIKVMSFGGFLWLGAYVLTRSVVFTRLLVVSLAALISMAFFLGSSALIDNNTQGLGVETGSLVTRLFWWSDVLPVAFWFHQTSLIARRTGKGVLPGIFVPLVYAFASFLILAGTFTDFLFNYSGALSLPGNRFYIGSNPGYITFILYLLLATCLAFYNVYRAWLNARFKTDGAGIALQGLLKLLVIGGFTFGVGGLWLTTVLYFNWSLPRLPGNLFLLVGLCYISYGVASYNFLLEGQNLKRDFVYSLSGTAFVCLLYVLLLNFTVGLSTLSLLGIIGLAIITHSNVDSGRSFLDRLFFTPPEREARAEARAFAQAIASRPVAGSTFEEAIAASMLSESEPEEKEASGNFSPYSPPEIQPAAPLKEAEPEQAGFDEKSFNFMVRKAITGLKSPPQMIKSPLLSLKILDQRLAESGLEDNRLNRATVLRELLAGMVENLRPVAGEESGTGEAWRFYNVLYYPYIRGYSRKSSLTEHRRLYEERRKNPGQREPGELEKVLGWLSEVDEDTFYKWQRKASDSIAAALREQELRLLSKKG